MFFAVHNPHSLYIFPVENWFRQALVEQEKEVVVLREENNRLKNSRESDKKRIRELENRLVNAESANTSLQRRVDAFCEAKVVLENEVSLIFDTSLLLQINALIKMMIIFLAG